MTRAALVGVALVALVWTWRNARGDIGWSGFVRDPASWDGRPAVASLFRVEALTAAGLRASKGGVELDVEGFAGGARVGDDVSFGGRWDHHRGVFVADWIDVAEGRAAKRWLSVLGLALCAGLAGGTLRRDADGWRVRG